MKLLLLSILVFFSTVAASVAEETNAPPTKITIDGVTYEDVRWGTVTPEAVSIFHKSGVASIPLEKLPLDLQHKFSYDPKRAPEYHRKTESKPWTAVQITEATTKLAASELAQNKTNEPALDLVRIALAFDPENKSALLLQGLIKRGKTVPIPDSPPLEQTLVEEALKAGRLEKNDYRRLLLYRLVEVVQPENEDAIVSLTRAENGGLDVSLDNLLRLSEQKHGTPPELDAEPSGRSQNQAYLKSLRQIAAGASLLARYELSQSRESKLGKDLLRIGLTFDPDNRTALLLTGMVKRGLAIKNVEGATDPKTFSRQILTVAAMTGTGNRRLLLYKLVEMIEPDNTEAIVALTAAENDGEDTSLDALLPKQNTSPNTVPSTPGPEKDRSRGAEGQTGAELGGDRSLSQRRQTKFAKLARAGLGARMEPQRTVALQKYHGSRDTERAVIAALRWLRTNQLDNGSWKCQRADEAGTSLALLAFLGHGETPGSPDFGPNVDKSIEYLVSRLDRNGMVPSAIDQYARGYTQGLVTLALSEAYAMTDSPALREPVERAVGCVLRWQKGLKSNPRDFGGWRYTPTYLTSDLSVSGWMIMALKSAKSAGIEVPQKAFDDAAKYVWNTYRRKDNEVGFAYSNMFDDPSPATTGIGVLSMQFMGQGKDGRIKSALDFLAKQQVDWTKAKVSNVLCGWYYITQAMFQAGGGYWAYWNQQIRNTMLKKQLEDGRWPAPPQSEDDPTELATSPVYMTSLGALILEVYYRYLPVNQLMEGQQADENAPALPQVGPLPNAPGQP